jgi:hypothetical protein
MEKNNDSIDLQSNSKRPRVEVDLANLTEDPCFRKKKKKKKSVIIILVIEIKSKEHIYKNELVNPLTIIFQEKNLEQQYVVLIQHGSKNINGWSTV